MPQPPATLPPPLPRRRGIALLLVLIVMALAAILSYAMLSASAVQATASGNAVAAAVARAQAESGIHLAMYYLLNPGNAPVLQDNYWPGATNIQFATTQPAVSMPGSDSVTVTSLGNNIYTVTSTGSSGSSAGQDSMSRTITANVQVVTSFVIRQAGGFNTSATVGSRLTFNGPVVSAGSVNITGGQVNGDISAAAVIGTFNGQTLPPPMVAPAPDIGTVADYTQPYFYQGALYYPAPVPGNPLSGTLGPSVNNPMGIYYYTGNLIVSGPLVINGTLAVRGGNLTNKSSITITAPQNMPALVVDQTIIMNGAGNTLSTSGVVYAGQGVTGGPFASGTTKINIDGALLITTGAISSYNGSLAVTYDSNNTSIPNFSSSNLVPTAVRIVSWSE